MPGLAESLVILIALLIVKNLDDFFAVATNHHWVVLRVHMYRPSAAFQKFGTIVLRF